MDIKNLFFNTKDFNLSNKKIGEGTFGTVYLAQNVQDGKNYAVKIIHTNEDFNGNSQMQFMQESIILQQLNHPAIVLFKGINFQSFTNSQKLEPSIITEYLSKGSLQDILRQERKGTAHHDWTPTKKYINIYGIARAMKYLHENKIIHRDLKTANILIDDDFYPRICDFGLSRCFPSSLSKSMNLTTGIGTPIYMSPELYNDEEQYNLSVDVYAFAMIVYEIISGKVPYFELDRISAISLSQKVINGYRPKFTDNINSKMRELLNRCWSQKPEERLSFAEICDLLESDFSYFGEDVDQIEFNYYVEIVNENGPNDKREKFESKVNNYLFMALDLLLGVKKARNPFSSLSYLKNSSSKGDSIASYLLGLLYESGEYVEQNFKQAEYYYNESAKQGNSNGFLKIGLCFMKGYGTALNKSKAFEYIEKSSNLGNSRAIVNLGHCYRLGFGVDQSKTKAFECYKKSAELGNSVAFCYLGLLYKNGDGVEQNIEKAIQFYQKSVDLGNSQAMCNLATCYKFGFGVEIDLIRSFELFKKSAELGNSQGITDVGLCYYEGAGVKKNYSKALEYFQKSANLGNSTALYYMGDLYYNGYGVKKNYSKAVEYFQKSANLGNYKASCELGFFYENGFGVEKNYNKAFELYQKSAKFDFPVALYNSGNCYLTGRGVQQNYAKALEFYQKAAAQGYPDAVFRIGLLYEEGKGVEKDYSKAIEYYQKAKNMGCD